jgi:biopolymer transport protein ExbD
MKALLILTILMLLGCQKESRSELSVDQIPFESDARRAFCSGRDRPIVLRIKDGKMTFNSQEVETQRAADFLQQVMKTRAEKVLHVDDGSATEALSLLREIQKHSPEVRFVRLPKGFVSPCPPGGGA